jgi:hypothetical protein
MVRFNFFDKLFVVGCIASRVRIVIVPLLVCGLEPITAAAFTKLN